MLGSRAARRVEVIGRERIVSERLSAKAPIRHFDFQLFFTMIGLSVIGVAAVYSSSRATAKLTGDDPALLMKRQLIYLAISAVVFVGALFFDYRQLRGFSPVLYGGALLLLILVLTPLGKSVSGAQRWIELGFFRIQPSELAKIASIILLAALFSEERAEANRDVRVLASLGVIIVPALLIFVQPDLGTLLVLPAVLFGVLLVAGARVRWLVLMILGGVIAFVLILNLGLIRDYQLARLTAFMDPKSDPQRAGYNLEQSIIAVGSGGMTGKGYLKGSQTNLDYVPEQHTDFIFTAIAEEKGFVGAMLVIGLFTLMLWRTLRIAMLSKDPFGTLLAAGIAAMISFQLFVNIGMTVGIMPITGIPLPFVSYGGSSLITNFAAIGLLMNVHMRRFL